MTFKDEMEAYILRETIRSHVDAGPKLPKGSKYRFKEVEPFIQSEMDRAVSSVKVIYKHIIRALKVGDITKIEEAERNAYAGFDKLKDNLSKFNNKLKRTYNL